MALFSEIVGNIKALTRPPDSVKITPHPWDSHFGGNVTMFDPETLQDYLLEAESGQLRNYYAFQDEMLARDPHLRALVETMQDYLLEATFGMFAYPATLRRASQASTKEAKRAQMISDYVEQELRRPEVRLDLAVRDMSFGFARGTSGLQVVVAPGEGPKIEGKKLERLLMVKGIPGQRFGFDQATGQVTISKTGEFLDGKDIVSVRSLGASVCIMEVDATMPNIARRGYLRSVLNHWLVRNLGLGWWSRFVEIYGTPFRQGTYPKGDEESRMALLAILKEAGNAGYTALPEGARMEIVDTFQRISGHSPHQTIAEWGGREMSKIILGHAHAIEVQQGTGSVQGSKHSDVIAVRKTNARGLQIAHAIRNGLVFPMVMRNFGVEDALSYTPEVQIVLEQRDSLVDLSKSILTFSQAGMTSIPVSEVHRMAGIRMAEAGEPTIMPIPMPGQPAPEKVGQPSDSREPATKPMDKPAGPTNDGAAPAVEDPEETVVNE